MAVVQVKPGVFQTQDQANAAAQYQPPTFGQQQMAAQTASNQLMAGAQAPGGWRAQLNDPNAIWTNYRNLMGVGPQSTYTYDPAMSPSRTDPMSVGYNQYFAQSQAGQNPFGGLADQFRATQNTGGTNPITYYNAQGGAWAPGAGNSYWQNLAENQWYQGTPDNQITALGQNAPWMTAPPAGAGTVAPTVSTSSVANRGVAGGTTAATNPNVVNTGTKGAVGSYGSGQNAASGMYGSQGVINSNFQMNPQQFNALNAAYQRMLQELGGQGFNIPGNTGFQMQNTPLASNLLAALLGAYR